MPVPEARYLVGRLVSKLEVCDTPVEQAVGGGSQPLLVELAVPIGAASRRCDSQEFGAWEDTSRWTVSGRRGRRILGCTEGGGPEEWS